MIFDVNSESDLMLLRRESVYSTDSFPTPSSIGLTSGCFDLFHYRHLVYLQKCRRLCDFLIVGVNSDHSTAELKGPGRPIIPEHERVAMVAALQCVNAAFILDSDFSRIGNLLANKIFRNEPLKEKVWGTDNGAQVVIVPDICVLDSTTSIIQEILSRKGT